MPTILTRRVCGGDALRVAVGAALPISSCRRRNRKRLSARSTSARTRSEIRRRRGHRVWREELAEALLSFQTRRRTGGVMHEGLRIAFLLFDAPLRNARHLVASRGRFDAES